MSPPLKSTGGKRRTENHFYAEIITDITTRKIKNATTQPEYESNSLRLGPNTRDTDCIGNKTQNKDKESKIQNTEN